MRTEFKKTQAQKRLHQGIYELQDEVAACEYTEDKMDEIILLDELMNSEYAEIVQLSYDGYTQSEIAVKMGTSQANVSKIFQKIRDVYGYD